MKSVPSLRPPPRATRFSVLDALLVLMTLIWGTNYVIIKSALTEIEAPAFNAVRLIEASLVMVAVMRVVRGIRREPDASGSRTLASVFHTPARLTRDDWQRLTMLGLVGHCLYQYLFIGGLARTSVANSSLLLATTPVVIALITVIRGYRIGVLHWAGTLLSLIGIYIVIGHGAHLGGASLRGDLMVAAAVLCWATYTLASQSLMDRHSPVGVTGISMTIGSAMYLPVAWPALARVQWTAVSARTWFALLYSGLLALCVAYTIWYVAVREIGSPRTAVYSNLVPVVAMAGAVLWLGEPLSASKLIGAAAVLLGVALTRM